MLGERSDSDGCHVSVVSGVGQTYTPGNKKPSDHCVANMLKKKQAAPAWQADANVNNRIPSNENGQQQAKASVALLRRHTR